MTMRTLDQLQFGITEHLEGALTTASAEVYEAAARVVRLADELGVDYAWFAEHHVHVHRGHLPTPLLFALHLAGQTKRIALGTAVICLNLHNPLEVAEQVAVADLLMRCRLAAGFGSGSTPLEASLFGAPDATEAERHALFAEALDAIDLWWSDRADPDVAAAERLPRTSGDLMRRCWSAVNSVGAASVAGARNLNILFSHSSA